MSILEVKGRVELTEPQMVFAVSGWVDGGFVASKVGEHLRMHGQLVAGFKPDSIYDYGSNRPTVEFSDGALREIHWPALAVTGVGNAGGDLLVVTGREPDLRWEEATTEIGRFADAAGVRRIVSVGAVPASVPHTRVTPIMTTSTDSGVDPIGLPEGRLVVPGSFVNVAAHTISQTNGIPEIGFWGQVPHYVSGVYWPGVEAMMKRLVTFLGFETDLGEIAVEADRMVQRLDEAVSNSPDAREFVRRLEADAPGFGLLDTPDLVEEVETFLRQFGDDENPFT